jgi:hypothetical protein
LNLRDSIIGSSGVAGIACYNHSTVDAKQCHLIGPSRIGADIFTGGHIEMSKTTIAGMTDVALWVHLAGSGYFEKMVVTNNPVDPALPPAVVVSQCRDRPLDFPGQECVLRAETMRPVRVSFDKLLQIISVHSSADRAQPGRGATPPVCKVCHNDASDCIFSPCAHCLYCRSCWEALPLKPQQCELCFIPIDKVVRPVDCSRQDTLDNECGICCDAPSDSLVMPCGHAICLQCGMKWFKEHSICPFCRTQNATVKRAVSYQ